MKRKKSKIGSGNLLNSYEKCVTVRSMTWGGTRETRMLACTEKSSWYNAPIESGELAAQ
jgi:hypothetical protein